MPTKRVPVNMDVQLLKALDKLAQKWGGMDRSTAIRLCIAKVLEAEGITGGNEKGRESG